MNILFLAPRLPWPADTGGKIRTLNILKQLIKKINVHLVSFSFEAKDQQWAQELKALGVKVTLVPLKNHNLFAKIIGILIKPIPYSMLKYQSPGMTRTLLTINQAEKFDAVHVDHLHMAHYCSCFPHLPCILDEHNVEYKILERCVPVEKSFLKKLVFKNQALKMKKFEAN